MPTDNDAKNVTDSQKQTADLASVKQVVPQHNDALVAHNKVLADEQDIQARRAAGSKTVRQDKPIAVKKVEEVKK
jgi:hypothetical protein